MTPQREAAPDHPRSRGVYCTICVTPMRRRGSSPLARGLLLPGIRDMIQSGIIPARAGFTSSSSRQSTGSWDHPRSRGVYCHWGACPASRSGSSPLARGLLPLPAPRHPSPGIIPARAGFTPLRYHLVPERQDHPRSRGVYLIRSPRWAGAAGSSPLARGLLRDAAPIAAALGIIPARAGFTRATPPSTPRTADHPRSREVYHPASRPAPVRQGSSPLARGLPVADLRIRIADRIIPARAGFTEASVKRGPGAHGSSPLARGLLCVCLGVGVWAADHPRSRGVYSRLTRPNLYPHGSSPLARGLP